MVRTGRFALTCWVAVVVALSHSEVTRVSAARQQAWKVSRTIDGHPDLEGVWNFATVTPLQRPERFAGRAFMDDAEAQSFEEELLGSANQDGRPGAVINDFWFERGPLARIDGRYPTSLTIDPADGRLPSLTAGAKASRGGGGGRRLNAAANFSLSERCLRSAAGPPYLPGAPDANLIRIVQSRTQVAIVQEKFHETRIVALTGTPHVAPSIRSWVGDARGRWDADTLVVETQNFTPQLTLANRFDEHLHLVERFTRVGPTTLLYEFTVHNPTFFTAPWTVRLPMTRTGEELYEFACHEGNYSLPNMLRGARAEEAAAAGNNQH